MNDASSPPRPDLAGLWVRTRAPRDPGDGAAAVEEETGWTARLLTPRWFAQWHLPRYTDAIRPLPLHQLSAAELAGLARQVAHVGCMQVDAHPEGELCHWLRRADYQPPGATPESGWLLFESPSRVVDVHVHDEDSSVWDVAFALTGAAQAGAFCLAGLDAEGREDGRLLLASGMHVAYHRPRRVRWPAGLRSGLSLVDVLLHRPDEAQVWLDHELSLARWAPGCCEVMRSTLPEQRGQVAAFAARRTQADLAWVRWRDQEGLWRVLDWHGRDDAYAA